MYSQDRVCNVPLVLEVWYWSESLLQHRGKNFPKEAEKCDTPIIWEHSPVPLLKNRNQNFRLPLPIYCPQPPCDVENVSTKTAQQCSKLSASQCKFTSHLVPCHQGASWLLLHKMCYLGWGSLDYIPVQIISSPPQLNTGWALLSLPEPPNSLPELPWGQPKVLLHGCLKLLPQQDFCFHDHQRCSSSGH